jgi:transcriptional regulator with XRE-family HTH domain
MIVRMLSPAQSRAGRALLGWSQAELAEASHLGLSTLRAFETGKRVPTFNNLEGIRRALEGAGVEFIGAPGAGEGVRFKAGAADRLDRGPDLGQAAPK